MLVHEPTIDDFGGAPVVEHDQACAVCHKRHAVYHMDKGVFRPCWLCVSNGWELIQKIPLHIRVKHAIFGGKYVRDQVGYH